MSDYWYTDEHGRKRHVGGDSSESYSVGAKHDYYAINSVFSSYSTYFSKSRLHSTHCPVCNDGVFFCECDNGGRVFFDTLAPTWKKHPCTTNYDSSNRGKTYYLIHPKENHFIRYGETTSKKTMMDVPDFMDRFELSLNNSHAYYNLVDNCTIMVRQHNSKLLLTIIVNNKKFKNEYLCNDKEFELQSDLEEFLKSVLWNTDFSVSLKIKKVQNKEKNKVESNGNHKIIKLNKQNVEKVLSVLTDQQKKIRQQEEAKYKERKEKRRQHNEASQNKQKLPYSQQTKKPIIQEQKPAVIIPKREGFSIVKKKNIPDIPIVTASTPKDNSKMSLDQFGTVAEALKAIKKKLQNQIEAQNNG